MSSEAERNLNQYLEANKLSDLLRVKKVPVEEGSFQFSPEVSPAMPEGLRFQRGYMTRTSGFHIYDEENESVFSSYTAKNPIIDPSNPKFMYFIEDAKTESWQNSKDRIFKINLDDLACGAEPTREVLEDIPVMSYSTIRIEPKGNFLVVMNPATDEYGFDPQGTLSIINKETQEVAKTFRRIAALGYRSYDPLPLEIDNEGSIFYPAVKDYEVVTRKIETNFLSLPSKGAKLLRETPLPFSAHKKPPGY